MKRALLIVYLLCGLARGQDALPLYAVLASARATSSPIDPYLVGWWKFDGNAFDSISTNNGVVTGATLTTGVYGQAYSFVGANGDAIRTTTDSVFDLSPTSAVTITCWMKCTTASKTQMLVSKMLGAPTYRGYNIYIQSGNQLASIFRNNNTGSKLWWVVANTNVANSSWMHVAAVYTGSGIASGAKLYIDGNTNFVQSTTTDTLGGLTIQTDARLTFGNLDGGGFPFYGLIDDVRIYRTALSQPNVIRVMNGLEPVY